MRLSHFALALTVAVVWGVNFVIMRIGLNGFPPLLLCAVRFLLVTFPAIFFLPRPKASWKLIAAFGVSTFTLQFGFMFTGIYVGMPPGLASLVGQTQAIFTMVLAVLVFGERPSLWKITGALISFSGIGIVAFHTAGGPVLVGFLLTLLAAFSWAAGNTVSKKIAADSPLALVVWGSLLALPPIVALSLLLEGPSSIGASFVNLTWPTAGAVCYLAFLSTHFGYSVWGFLLNKYPATMIAPFSLLVPVFGFLAAAVFLGEELPFWKVGASLVIIGGLAFNLLESRFKKFRPKI